MASASSADGTPPVQASQRGWVQAMWLARQGGGNLSAGASFLLGAPRSSPPALHCTALRCTACGFMRHVAGAFSRLISDSFIYPGRRAKVSAHTGAPYTCTHRGTPPVPHTIRPVGLRWAVQNAAPSQTLSRGGSCMHAAVARCALPACRKSVRLCSAAMALSACAP